MVDYNSTTEAHSLQPIFGEGIAIYAGFLARLGASLLDFLIIIVAGVFLGFIVWLLWEYIVRGNNYLDFRNVN